MNENTDKNIIFKSSAKDANFGLILSFIFLLITIYTIYTAKHPDDNTMIFRFIFGFIIMFSYFIYRLFIGAKPVISLTPSGLTVHKTSTRSVPWSKIKSVELCSRKFQLYNPDYVKVGVDKAFMIGSHNNLPKDQVSYLNVDKPSFSTSANEVYYAILAHWERYRDGA